MNYSRSLPMPAGLFMLRAVDPISVTKPTLDFNHPPKNFKFKRNKKKGKK